MSRDAQGHLLKFQYNHISCTLVGTATPKASYWMMPRAKRSSYAQKRWKVSLLWLDWYMTKIVGDYTRSP